MSGWLIAWVVTAVVLYGSGLFVAWASAYGELDTSSEKAAFWLLMGPGWLIASAVQSFIGVGVVWGLVKLIAFLAKQ